ncbi:MAG TPA: DUF6036 family nucleotidyltransferase [Candidatus Polarisedimenticolaceae bacterium]|nr:DUF6036 family nucleotidyltransferase [Candidatus Polarisedimenticolaceae bacterium]
MREPVDALRLRRFMRRLGESGGAARVYLTGGATAVLRGWRASTIDIDLLLVPDDDLLLRAIQELKEELHVNVEIAGPSHFLPELPGWEGRSRHLGTEGKVHFHEYDLYSQVLAKIERAHVQDLEDVRHALADGEIELAELWRLFDAIVPQLHRFPAVDRASFERRLEGALGDRHL